MNLVLLDYGIPNYNYLGYRFFLCGDYYEMAQVLYRTSPI